MDLVRNRCLGTAKDGTSRILSVKARCNRRDPPDDDLRVVGWATALGRFVELAEEAAERGCFLALIAD